MRDDQALIVVYFSLGRLCFGFRKLRRPASSIEQDARRNIFPCYSTTLGTARGIDSLDWPAMPVPVWVQTLLRRNVIVPMVIRQA